MYKEVKTMKKLGKKLETTMDTLEAYSCDCMCDAGKCYRHLGSMTLTATLGIQGQNGAPQPL